MKHQAKPVLKWVGGKTQLLDTLVPLVTLAATPEGAKKPEPFRCYYEPFFGGGSVFFRLYEEGLFQKAVVNDINPVIFNFYEKLKEDPDGIANYVDEFKALGLNRENYAYIRDLECFSETQAAAKTLYLNKTCFNGLYRVNKAGKFNVPWNKREEVTFYDIMTMRACAKALDKAKILNKDFVEVTRSAKAGDFVYYDPPYAPVSKTSSFNNYAKEGFDWEDQIRVFEEFDRLAKLGVNVMLSNSDTWGLRDLFKDYRIETVKARRNVNSKGTKRGKVNEILVLGGPMANQQPLEEFASEALTLQSAGF